MATVLVVDDNEANRDLARQYLQMKGYTLLTAKNGQEGLDLARAQQPQLIILDMDMPILSGWDAAGRLKQDEATKHIPILALTAHGMIEDKRRALAAGCDDYLAKPMDLKELLERVQALIEQASSAPSTSG